MRQLIRVDFAKHGDILINVIDVINGINRADTGQEAKDQGGNEDLLLVFINV